MTNYKNDSIVLFFVDGLGIGKSDHSNPLHAAPSVEPLAYFSDFLTPVYGNGIFVPTDPRLGIEGRPQSATGQTTIYTGSNAAALLSRHLPGFPNRVLRDLIGKRSIFRQLDELGISPNVFANTYTPGFFEKTPRWKSATTCSVEAANLGFCTLPDLIGRKSVFHDFTNKSLIDQGYDVPEFSPRDAGEILVELSQRNRFVLYEYFITDKIGHAQDFEMARLVLPKLAEMIRVVADSMDRSRTTLILTSDHGNIEDLSVRNHTLNDVPTVIWGKHKETLAKRIRSLTDITPAIVDLLT